MKQNKGIYWLASYPKSGNTWFRIFLANVLSQDNMPVDINNINIGVNATSRDLINTAIGFDSTLLSHDEMAVLRPSIYTWYAKEAKKISYVKIHDAYNYTPIIPREGSLGAVYFIRNPLDVSISYAHHCNCSIDNAIEHMSHKKGAVCYVQNGPTPQVRQFYLSWSHHVQSWMSCSDIDILPLRYEDMSSTPFETFKKAINFLKIDVSDDRIRQALDHTQLKNLQQQEKKSGFRESSFVQTRQFFRKGIVGDWKNTLSKLQIKRIIKDHGELMEVYGYLDKKDCL